MAIKSYRDITANIPSMFMDSGAPTAPHCIGISGFSSSSRSSRDLTEHPPWVAAMMPKSWFFQRFPRISMNLLIAATQGACSASCSGGVVEARKTEISMQCGAVGAPESRNISGMYSVLSIRLFTTIRGAKTEFWA